MIQLLSCLQTINILGITARDAITNQRVTSLDASGESLETPPMLKGRCSLIHAERHLPRHSSEFFNSVVPVSFKSLTKSSMRQSLRFSVLHWPSPSSRNRGSLFTCHTRRSQFIHATTAVLTLKINYQVQLRDISAWTQRPISNMPEKTGTRQATLGYVRDPQPTIWCVGLSL